MKMSKSIKDYKDAMDNIKISDSFYKRTESLLTELPEIEIGKKPVMSAGKVTAALSAAAACLLVAFGVKFALERDSGITTVTEVTDITEITEVTGTAPPIINSLTEAEQDDIANVAADGMDIQVHSDNDFDGGAAVTSAPLSETQTQTQAPVKTSAPPVSAANPAAGGDNAAAVQKTSETAVSEAAGDTAAAETVPLLSDISYEHVTVEITPYFDMGNIKSGENPVKKEGEDCKPIIEFIAGLTETSREIGNYSFTSLFSLRIADESIGVTFYSIYVTDLNAVVITKHGTDGQIRETYAANSSDYEALKHILFLQFGTEDEYELFSNLISGK